MTELTFVAGGSKGLGVELVNQFTEQGHQVLEFSRSGQGQQHIACDFADPNSCQATFAHTFAQHRADDGIHLLINTATLAPFGPLSQADPAVITQHLAINVTSTLLLIRAFLAAYQDTDCAKTIAYISSGAARRAIPGLAVYSASKAFFERYIDTLATEQQDQTHPVRCLVINPGVMNTDMQAEIRAQDKTDFPMVDMWQEFHATGQLAAPQDIAAVCLRLLQGEGENGGYYTAQEWL
ncbi:SDR family NAD(P)-dependent oxidoreductase [Marinicella meishanensis]|uniref:SDR family NAD(P)-dependent oxidoreductase n=1 Tax=Marinicella meishanensis TaxID=2873263 RepID=UPI001CC0E5C7|nr:SDR family NAD(P)-dependent oxidoreductase [Marinicella sp. NBU2979]